MRVRQLIIETLLKEVTEEEKLAADLLDGVFDEIESDIKANKDALIPQQQNEALGLALLGGVVAAPAIMKIIGKGVKLGQNAIRKRKGEEPLDSNAIIKMADKLHKMLVGGVEKALFFVKDKKKRHRLAVIIFHAIIAGLLVASGKGLFKALAKHQTIAAFLEGMLTAIKTGELGAFALESFSELATALGTGAELADAADLADMASAAGEATSDITETCTMTSGAVQGAAGSFGKEADIYDVWKQKRLEENNMNKFKITKGRLRQIIFEEVQRAKRLDEAWSKDAERDEAAQTASETDAAQYMTQAEGVVDEPAEAATNANAKEDAIRELASAATAGKVDGADVDPQQASAIVQVLDALSDDAKNRFLKLDVSQMAEMAMRLMKEDVAGEDRPESEEHFSGAAADDTAHIDALERDRREDEESEDGWHSDEYETLADRKYADRLREQVQQSLEEILSEDPVDEGAEERVAKFNKGPSTEERREKLKKIAAANKAKKEKDKK